MKIITVFLLSVLSSLALAQTETCAYYTRQCPSKFASYNDATRDIDSQVKRKEITELKGAQKVSDLAHSMFPQDALLISIVMQQATMARVLALSNLSQAQKDELDKSAGATYSAALIERFAFLDAAKEAGEQMVRVQNQAAPQQVIYSGGGGAVNDALPTAMFLNKVGNAFATSFGQSLTPPPRICMYGKGTSMCY